MIGEGILLRSVIDRHAPIRPGMQVRVAHAIAVVVVADILGHDASIRLAGKRADYV